MTVAAALKANTRTSPIVFVVVSDPIGSGLVESLPKPGGNVTGFLNIESSLGGKVDRVVAISAGHYPITPPARVGVGISLTPTSETPAAVSVLLTTIPACSALPIISP